MTKSNQTTSIVVSNVIDMTPDEALKAVKAAGNAEHGGRSQLAHAMIPALQQAYEGNLGPCIEIAAKWSDSARKAANSILSHFSGGTITIRVPSKKGKGVSMAKGWSDTKVDDFDFAGLAEAIVESQSKTAGGKPIAHRANIYKLAKSLSEGTEKAPDTLVKIATRTIKAVQALTLPGISDDEVRVALADAIALISDQSEAALKAVADAVEAANKRPNKRKKAA